MSWFADRSAAALTDRELAQLDILSDGGDDDADTGGSDEEELPETSSITGDEMAEHRSRAMRFLAGLDRALCNVQPTKLSVQDGMSFETLIGARERAVRRKQRSINK